METFNVKVYSGPERDNISVWCDHWHCTICQRDIVNGMFYPEFDAKAPLHNPMYCSGKSCGMDSPEDHVTMPCRPFGEVFLYDIPSRTRTVIGRIDR
jgi:hypothetical protein